MAADRDVRFAAPAVPPRYVARPRLTDRLDATPAPLTLLAAGPGWGKSALLSAWARRGGRPVSWVSPAKADAAAPRFWPLFLAAARAAGLPVHEAAQLWRDPAGLAAATGGRQATIVLDDAHLLTDPAVIDGLDLVVRRCGAVLRLVLAARSDPLLPLDAYRTDGRVCELRAADLAMTAAEAGLVLAAHGVTLPERDMSVLMERTGGWAAGVRLCAMRMEGAPVPQQFVRELALDQGSVGEFLVKEVLDRQPPEVRAVLLQTSFLPEVSGRLADAVCGTTGARDVLGALARRNSFVVTLDASRSRFRYHPLLREVLLHLLDREPVERRRALRRRAAAWEHRHGDVVSGLAHAVAGGDRSLTAELLVHGGLAAAFAGRRDLPLARLPPGDGRAPDGTARWEVPVAEAALAAVSGPLDDHSAAALGRVRAAAGPDPDGGLTLDLAALVLARRTADPAAVESAVDRLLAAPERLDTVPGLRAGVLLARARARFLLAGPQAASAVLAAADASAEVEASPSLRLEVLAVTAALEVYEAGRRHPDDSLVRAQELMASEPGLVRPAALDLAVSGWAYLRADYETATAAARRARAAAEADDDAALAAGAAVLLARIMTAGGDPRRALILLDGAAAALGRAGGLLAAASAAERARALTALGRPRDALAVLAAWRGSVWEVQVAVPAADACRALGDLDEAAGRLAAVLDVPAANPPRYLRVGALLRRAALAWRSADEQAACLALLRAVEAADGVVAQPFLEMSAELTALVQRRPELAARLPVPVASALPHQHDADGPDGIALSANEFARLTGRERVVLRLLTTDLATSEIADELFVSPNTVKTHLSSLYRKLGARGRVDAVARARALELL